MPWITYQEKTGEPIKAGKVRITPISRALSIIPPGWNGGFIWNRPAAVRVDHESGEWQVIPVQDITRQTIVLLATISLIFTSLIMIINHIKGKESERRKNGRIQIDNG
jgi:hypothetical protein